MVSVNLDDVPRETVGVVGTVLMGLVVMAVLAFVEPTDPLGYLLVWGSVPAALAVVFGLIWVSVPGAADTDASGGVDIDYDWSLTGAELAVAASFVVFFLLGGAVAMATGAVGMVLLLVGVLGGGAVTGVWLYHPEDGRVDTDHPILSRWFVVKQRTQAMLNVVVWVTGGVFVAVYRIDYPLPVGESVVVPWYALLAVIAVLFGLTQKLFTWSIL